MKKLLLLWTFLQLLVVYAFAQSDVRGRTAFGDIQKPDLRVARIMDGQLHSLQKQALNLKSPASLPENTRGLVSGEGKKIYGYLEFDDQIKEKGIIELSLDHLQEFSFLYKTNGFTICAGAYANDSYYYYAYTTVESHVLPLGFYKMDLESGKSVMIKDYSTMKVLFGDMTYDYVTNTMWAYSSSSDGSSLHTVDLTTGDCTDVATLKQTLIAMAADVNGELYGVTVNGDLCTINKINGEITTVGATGISPAYRQSMEFDRNSNELYWAATTTAEKGFLAKVDTKTGKAANLGTIGNNSQILGLYIPYTASLVKAPVAPSDLSITLDGFSNKVSLSWTNPTKDVVGNELTALTSVQIYRNGDLIHTIANPVVGGKADYIDMDVPIGMTTYSITASNEGGESSAVSLAKFVGRDIPAAPKMVSAERLSNNSIRLSWSAPAIGLNGGWIDVSTLSYKITRYPDKVVITESTDQTGIDDNNISDYNSYYYSIQAFNTDGEGGKATSNKVGVGNPFTVPYSCTFETDADFNKWTVIDANQDKVTWIHYMKTAQYNYSSTNSGDDWLISPPVTLEKGKAYKVSFDVLTGGMPEKLKVTFGKDDTAEGQAVVLDEATYSSQDVIRKTVYLPENIENDAYRVGLYACSDAYKFYISVSNLVLEESNAGSITGKVTDADGTSLAGCVVSVKETGAKVTTDAEGKYRLLNIEAGTYTVVFTKTGYVVKEESISVQEKAATELNATLVSLPRYSITGKIVGTNNELLAGVSVFLDGYVHLEAVTDAGGVFTITGVYQANSYTLSIKEKLYYYYSQLFDLAGNKDLGTVVLTERELPPYGLTVNKENDSPVISWKVPADLTDFIYDDGTSGESSFGFDYGNEASVFGNVYRVPMLFNNVSWYLTDEKAINDKVNIYIFDLDEKGNPTNHIIYSERGVPTQVSQWSTYNFKEEVYAPNGCLVAFSVDEGNLSLGVDGGTNPFAEHLMCYNDDFTANGFVYLESWDTYNSNLMIRVNSFPLGKVDEPVTADIDRPVYKVWRLLSGKEKEEPSWTLLTTEPQTGMELADTKWKDIPQGIYRYAVKTVSSKGVSSVPAFSDVLYKDMFTTVTVNVHTNTTGKSSEGAIVTLYNDEHVYTDTIGKEEKIKFSEMWKGIYSVKVVLPGYTALIKNEVDFSKEAAYSTEAYTLQEIIEKPFNIFAENTEVEGECLLTWDRGLFDNFETHPDFTINSPGVIGWSYIDADQSETWGSAMYEFPGMEQEMAYIIMNATETAPGDTAAYSGNKYLASFAAQSGYSDDWIISPELKSDKDFTISFYARSYESAMGLEIFRIGYSMTGKEIDDFSWIENSKQDVPVVWTHYEFNVPAEAKYVTINSISMNTYLLMIDDVFIDAERSVPQKEYYSYDVYLNDKLVKHNTTDHSFLLQGLVKGENKASVRRVYSSGESGPAELSFVSTGPDGIRDVQSGIDVYPNPATDCFYVKGEYTGVRVIDKMGRVVIDRDNSDNCIRVTSLPSDFYFVQITAEKGVTIRKIFVK